MTKMDPYEERIIRIASYASVCIAALLIAMKFFAWWETHSVSLQASLIDSCLDAIASFINMIAIYQALKPPDERHRFGHGKIESLSALAQALFIGGSAIWLVFEAYEKFEDQDPVEQTGLGLVVMLIAIAIVLVLLAYQRFVIKKTKSNAIAADMLHFKADLLVNIAVVCSLLGSMYFKIPYLDPIFGIVIGLYIFWTAWQIMMRAFNVLMDSEVDEEDRQKILKIINAHPQVVNAQDLKTRQSGLQQFFQLNLVMDPNITVKEADKISDEVEKQVYKAFPKSQVTIRFVPIIPKGIKHPEHS